MEKYQKDGFDFKKAEESDAENKVAMAKLLQQLDGMLKSKEAFAADGQLGWDDVMYLVPLLLPLT